MSSIIRIAIVGYGHWGPNYGRVCTELPDVELVGICDPLANRHQAAKLRHPRVAVVSSVEELIQSAKPDAVIVASPAATHRQVATAVIQAGCDVLVEKPLALNLKDCEAINELADKHRRILMTGHTFLFNSAIQWLKEHLQRGMEGQLHYLYSARTNLGPIRSDADSVWDLAPHDIAVFEYLLGMRPQWISAAGATRLNREHADVAFLTFGYGNGVIGNIHVSWLDPKKVRELVLVGSHQRIVFNDLDALEPIRIFHKGVAVDEEDPDDFGSFRLRIRDGDIVSPKIVVSEPLKVQCQHFVNCVRLRQQPLSDGAFGCRVVQILEAARTSLSQNGTPVKIGV